MAIYKVYEKYQDGRISRRNGVLGENVLYKRCNSFVRDLETKFKGYLKVNLNV